MRNKEGNPSLLTPMFPSFGKTELKHPSIICILCWVMCYQNLKKKKKTADFCSKRKSSTFCSSLPSILQYVHFTSAHAGAHGQRLLDEMPIIVIVPTTFDFTADGGWGRGACFFYPTAPSNEKRRSVAAAGPHHHVLGFL